jgi:tetratricopeptide (TPR) repeat protein
MTQLCRRRRKESLGSGEDESERLLTSSPTAAEDTARLLALSLWEVYEDLHDPQAPALALNALVRPLAGTLNESEQATLAGAVTGALFEQWGGEKGGKQRGWLQNHELTRLGLLARDARVLAATGASALRFLDNQFQYRQAAAWAKDILAIVDAANVPTSVDLLRTAAERCQQVGEVAEANTFRERAMQLLGQGGETDTVQNAATLLTHARALVEQGQPDEALRHLEQAEKLLPPGREQAIVLGAIAEIQLGKGDVNTALDIHQQELRLYEALGDKHSRAVTLGEIARIKRQKGEVDAALQLHQERLGIFEALGAKRERAVTLGDIARIRADKGEVDAALQLHQERLGIFEALGAKRERAVTPGDIARIRADKGEVDAALQLHQEMLGIFEALGDLDGKANMLWSIAQIEVQREKWQEAYDHLAESYAINLKLGRLDGICMVGLSLGQLLCMAGQREQGLAILTRSRDGFLKLGQARMAQQTQALLDRISQSPPQP